MSTQLLIENLSCHYPGDKTPVLADVSFALHTGELAALLGPSGCGKTTLLRVIAGFHPLQSGSMQLHGQALDKLASNKRGIGFVFQDYALFPHMTVADNIGYGIHKRPDRQQRIQEMLALVNLEGYEQRYPEELSGGQQQRVALARALAPQPQLLLLDEPFSNLDTELRKSLSLNVREILKAANVTAILVTHDQSEAFAFADTVGVMNKGKLEQWDSPFDLYHKPKTRFVASFVGQGQLIKAEVNGQRLHTAFGDIDIAEAPDSKTVMLLSRQDDWQICADDCQQHPEHQVTIRHKQFLGTQTLYWIEAANGEQIGISTPSHQNHAIGERICICPQFEHVITF